MNSSKIIRATLLTSTFSKTYLNRGCYPCLRTHVRNLHDKRSARPFLNQVQHVTTLEAKPVQQEDSLLEKILNKIPFLNIKKSKLGVAGYVLYESIADKISYVDFFHEFDLPDTFYSWFVVTELHIWMLSARVMADGKDGRIIRNSIVEALWADINQRVKRLGAINPSIMRLQVSELSEQLQAALIAYDEGLQSDDVVLAGALWRRFYQQEDCDPKCLELLVKYIRKQMKHLDCVSVDQLVRDKSVNWIPFKE